MSLKKALSQPGSFPVEISHISPDFLNCPLLKRPKTCGIINF
jgi:hypothetical protein